MPVDSDALARLRKLRSLGVHRGARHLQPGAAAAAPQAPVVSGRLAELPGEPVATPQGEAWVRTERYELAVSPPALASLPTVAGDAFAALGRDPALAALDPARAAFIDTETTGLDLGTGTYTFLIGVGRYEPAEDGQPAAFVVQQFFMRNPGEELAQLFLVEQALAGCDAIVSFNGRSFDLPLMRNRYMLASQPFPLPHSAPHLDLLPPARRLFRARYGSCTLGDLERNVLGLQRSEADVPGWMIPGIYRDYYHGANNVDLLASVFYHNLQDVATMPLLAATMARFFERTLIAERLTGVHPLECASLARCYADLAWLEASEAAYRAALNGSPTHSLADDERQAVLHDLALLLKHAGRRAEAAEVWETWISSVVDADLTPYIELAKHHEWHTGDLAAARGWTAWAMRIVESWPPHMPRNETLEDLARRLARLERKLNGG